MARRGRKPNPNARRRQTTRAGRTPADLGTPQARAQRARLVGEAHAADPRAGDVLGVLALLGLIDDSLRDAGWRYAVLRWRLFGRPFPSGSMPGHGGDPDAFDSEPAEKRFARLDTALRDAGRLAHAEVRWAAVEQRTPTWLARARAGRATPGDYAQIEALQRGLRALDAK